MDSDPELEIIGDSGMSSIGDSKDETPERKEPVCGRVCVQSSVMRELQSKIESTMLTSV